MYKGGFMDFKLLLKLKGLWDRFRKNHPKFPNFIKEFKKKGIKENAVIEMKITYDDGSMIETNIKVQKDDLAIIEELKNIKK